MLITKLQDKIKVMEVEYNHSQLYLREAQEDLERFKKVGPYKQVKESEEYERQLREERNNYARVIEEMKAYKAKHSNWINKGH